MSQLYFDDGKVNIKICGKIVYVDYAGITRIFEADDPEEMEKSLAIFPDHVVKFVMEKVRIALKNN